MKVGCGGPRFRLPASDVITGRFSGDEVFANMTGAAMPSRSDAGVQNIISKEQVALAEQEMVE